MISSFEVATAEIIVVVIHTDDSCCVLLALSIICNALVCSVVGCSPNEDVYCGCWTDEFARSWVLFMMLFVLRCWLLWTHWASWLVCRWCHCHFDNAVTRLMLSCHEWYWYGANTNWKFIDVLLYICRSLIQCAVHLVLTQTIAIKDASGFGILDYWWILTIVMV